MAELIEGYMKLCAQSRVEPYYGLVCHVDEAAVDCAVDFVPLNSLALFTGAMKACSNAGLIRLVLSRERERGMQHPSKGTRRVLPVAKLLREHGRSPLPAAACLRCAIGAAQVCRTSVNLKRLELVNIPFGSQGASKFAPALPFATQIECVCFDGSMIGDSGFDLLTPAFSQLQHLSILSVARCDLTDSSAKNIAAVLKASSPRASADKWATSLRSSSAAVDFRPTALRKYNLEHNYLGDVSAESLAVALTVVDSLTSLGLAHNGIDGRGIGSILMKLQLNKALEMLTLSGNPGADSVVVPDDSFIVLRDAVPEQVGCVIIRLPEEQRPHTAKSSSQHTQRHSPTKSTTQTRHVEVQGIPVVQAATAAHVQQEATSRQHAEKLDEEEPLLLHELVDADIKQPPQGAESLPNEAVDEAIPQSAILAAGMQPPCNVAPSTAAMESSIPLPLRIYFENVLSTMECHITEQQKMMRDYIDAHKEKMRELGSHVVSLTKDVKSVQRNLRLLQKHGSTEEEPNSDASPTLERASLDTQSGGGDDFGTSKEAAAADVQRRLEEMRW